MLVTGVFVNRAGSFFSMFVVLYLTDHGFTLAELPAVLMAVAAAGMAGSLGGGWLADRFGRKASLVMSMAAAGISLAAMSVASGTWQIVVAVSSVALFTQAYVPAASALIADHCAPEDRVPVFALFRLALNVGAAAGPLLAGMLASTSYSVLFAVDSSTCLLFAALLALGLPRAERTAGQANASPDGDRTACTPSVRGSRPATGVLVLCLGLFLVALVYAQYSSTLPLRLTADGMSPRFFGTLLAFNAALVIALELPLSGLTRRLGPRLPLTGGAVLISLGMALSGTVDGTGLIFAAVAIWSLGEVMLAPVASAAVAALSPPDKIGRYQGILGTAQSLGFSVGPAVGTYALAVDATLPWIGCLAIGALALPLLLVAVPPVVLSRARHAAGWSLVPVARRAEARHHVRTPSAVPAPTVS